jgi:hypothetical protein
MLCSNRVSGLLVLFCLSMASAFDLSGTCVTPYRNAPGFRIVDTVAQRWHHTAWGNSLRSSSIYDRCGLTLDNATYRWYPPTSRWVLGWRTMVVRRVCRAAGSDAVDDITLQFDTVANAFDTSGWRYGGLVDTPGNVVVLHNQTWDTTLQRFVNGTLVTEKRDSADRPLLSTTQQWDTGAGAYRNATRDSSAYAAGGPTLNIHAVWDTLGLRWRSTERLTCAYQAGNGNLADSTVEPLDTAGSPTASSRSWSFVYDSLDRRTQVTISRWSGTAWFAAERQGFLGFDAHGNYTELTRAFYSVPADTWSTPTRTQFAITYDADQNLTELVSRNWNSQTLAWTNYERATYVYEQATAVRRTPAARSRAAGSLRLGVCRRSSGLSVTFTLALADVVTLALYDAAGRLVVVPLRSQRLAAGEHAVAVPAASSSGMLFVRLAAGNASVSARVIAAH